MFFKRYFISVVSRIDAVLSINNPRNWPGIEEFNTLVESIGSTAKMVTPNRNIYFLFHLLLIYYNFLFDSILILFYLSPIEISVYLCLILFGIVLF